MSEPTGNPMELSTTWDLVAAEYASQITPYFERYAEAALDATGVMHGQRVVDVAAGPGTLSLLAARRGVHVEALDFSEKMVAELGARARAAGLDIEARVGDGMALPYADDSFDAGFSMFGLFMFSDRDRGFRELRRVVRPGGAVAVTSWQPRERVPAMVAMFESLRRRMPQLPSSDDPPLSIAEGFRSEMEAAGLRDVSIRELCYAKPFPSGAAVWAWMAATFAPLRLLASKLGEGWPPLDAALRDDLARALGDGPVMLELPAWLGVAIV